MATQKPFGGSIEPQKSKKSKDKDLDLFRKN